MTFSIICFRILIFFAWISKQLNCHIDIDTSYGLSSAGLLGFYTEVINTVI